MNIMASVNKPTKAYFPQNAKENITNVLAGSWRFGGSKNQPKATIIAEMALICARARTWYYYPLS